jgi:hypothetical protein
MTYAQTRAAAMDSHDRRQHMYKRGGEVHPDEAQDKELIRDMVKPADLKKGAKVEGRARGGKADRPGKAKTVVNVMVPPATSPAPVIPPRPPVMAAPPPQMPPPRPPMMPPPGQPGMGPMAGPPPGGMMPRAKGGRAHRDLGGATPNFSGNMTPQVAQNSQAMGQTGPMLPGARPPMKKGGRAERAKGGRLDAGAASGVGRIEKAEDGRKGAMIEYGD